MISDGADVMYDTVFSEFDAAVGVVMLTASVLFMAVLVGSVVEVPLHMCSNRKNREPVG